MNRRVMFGLIAVLMACGVASEEEPSVAPQTPAIDVAAAVLFSDYKANQIAADNKYKDKVVRIEGVVGSIGKDILDDPYVTLTGEGDMLGSVQCMLAEEEAGRAATLREGEPIIMQGRVDGMLINVLVRECRIM